VKKIFLCALIFCSLEATAATYYVATTGNDFTGNGSIGSPWQTIPKAMRSLRAGDWLYIRGGTYSISSGYGNSSSDTYGCIPSCPTSWAGATKIMNYPGEKVVINHAGFNMDNAISAGGVAYLIWQGDRRENFIHNAINSGDLVGLRVNDSAHHVRFQSMTIQNFKSTAGIMWACSHSDARKPSFLELIDNLVQYNGDGSYETVHEHGIYVSCGQDLLLTRNKFFNNWAFGIHGNAHLGSDRWTVTQNLIEGRSGTEVGTTACIYVTGGSQHLIANNICIANGSGPYKITVGVATGETASSTVIANNTIYGTPLGVQILRNSGFRILNNLFVDVPTGVQDIPNTNYISNNLSVSAGSGFANVNPASSIYDFHLTQSSPAIDKGIAVSGFTDYFGRTSISTDYTGAARIGAIDIGAFEFGSAAPAASKPLAPKNLQVQ
jgi:hypothetical protein